MYYNIVVSTIVVNLQLKNIKRAIICSITHNDTGKSINPEI